MPSNHRLRIRHQTIYGMYQEWYGLGEHENTPIEDGIAGLEAKFGSKWRKGFHNREKKHFSCVKCIMQALRMQSNTDNLSEYDVAHSWQTVFTNECRSSVAAMDKWVKNKGLVPTRRPRGKSAVTSAEETIEEN